MENVFGEIEQHVKEVFEGDSSGHDLYHLKRVFNNALTIQKVEGGNALVIGAAALTHDIHRIVESKTGKFFSPKDSLPQVKSILDKTGLPEREKEMALHCVEFHEEYAFSETGNTVDDIETLVLQDADNLDALGAIGVGRTFAFGVRTFNLARLSPFSTTTPLIRMRSDGRSLRASPLMESPRLSVNRASWQC